MNCTRPTSSLHRFPSAWTRSLSALLLVGLLAGVNVQAGSYEDYFKAVRTDNAGSMRALLRRGLDPNLIEAVRGETGLMLALREDSMDVFQTLMKSSALDLNARARNGDTALMIATYKGNVVAVKALLAKGANLQQSGWNALHYAAAAGHTDIARLLLQRAPELRDSTSPSGMTPTMMAAMEGHIYIVKLLLDAGADPWLKSQGSMTATDFARQYGHPDIEEGLAYRMRKRPDSRR